MNLLKRMYRNETSVPFSKLWKPITLCSLAVLILSIGGLGFRGLNLGLEFEGGGAWEVPAENIQAEEVVLGGILLDPDAIGRISGLFGDELILGNYLSKLFFLLSALIYSLKNSFFKKVGYVLLPLTFILILVSGDRTALFLTIITIVFAIFMLEASEFRKKIIYSSLSLFVLISVLVFLLGCYPTSPKHSVLF